MTHAPTPEVAVPDTPPPSARANLDRARRTLHGHVDALMAVLLAIQWAALVGITLFYSPTTWIGERGEVHAHVWWSLTIGALAVAPPILMVWTMRGAALTRHAVALGQMTIGGLLIHVTGGRIETHFHVFGSLAFLAMYRDWTVIVTGTLVVVGDHFVRGIWFPASIFGVAEASRLRWLEHAGWVVFEDVVLIGACVYGVREMRATASHRAELQLAEAEATARAKHRQHLTERVVARIESIQSSGDLSQRIEVDEDAGRDHVRMAEGVNGLVATLEQTVRDILLAADEASRSVATMSSTSQDLASAVAEVASRSSQTEASAARAGQDASEGGRVIGEAIARLRTIGDEVGGTSEQVRQLVERTAGIETIVTEIQDIADQTNLLALNATIEAARAGDAGAGFAVVAQEVRVLADRTAQATTRIFDVVQGARGDGAATVERVDRSLDAVQSGTTSAGTAAGSLRTIVAGTQQLREQIEMISSLAAVAGSRVAEMDGTTSGLAQRFRALETDLRRFSVSRSGLPVRPADPAC